MCIKRGQKAVYKIGQYSIEFLLWSIKCYVIQTKFAKYYEGYLKKKNQRKFFKQLLLVFVHIPL